MSSKVCDICGKPSGIYPLCKKHLEMKAEGQVYKNQKSGKWEYSCMKDNEENQEEENNVSTSNKQDDIKKSKCIICGLVTDSYLFCKNCYYKYKDKELLIKITNCSDIEIYDETYEGKYVCKDGHIVKSKSERDIDNYLYDNKIPHAYEKAFPIDESPEHDLHPDFTLPGFQNGDDVYIEHWGYDENNIKYTKTKKYKLPIYEKRNITLICTNEKEDMKDINTALKRKLEFYKPNVINFN